MTRIALIGDIHGNLPALESVLQHASSQNVHQIWNTGDLVGYGPYPDEVVRLIRQLNIRSVQGNYDRKVLLVPQKAEKWATQKRPEKLFSFLWTFDHLSSDNRQYLQNLPIHQRLSIDGWKTLLVHGSPQAQNEHLLPDTPDERLAELARTAEADVIICGHSHLPFVRQVSGTYFINTGSVGRSDDGDPRACYALLELGEQYLQVEHIRISYDIERVVKQMQLNRMPVAFVTMIRQGVNFDEASRLLSSHERGSAE